MSPERAEAAWTDFAARLSYIPTEYAGADLQGYAELARRFEQLDGGSGAGLRRLFYLATPPALFAPIMARLSDAQLAGQAYQPAKGGWARFVIEKPFGRDLASARALNADIARRFAEHDIYRIDHFLGKEIVQNLFALRFANAIFEPVWNRNYIDHVQITATETLGMEGRGGYYETAGAVRDMVQNHLLQLCALVAIEPPAAWNSRAVRDEKVKVLRAVRRIVPGEVERDAVRGQYRAGSISGERVPAYREEEKVATPLVPPPIRRKHDVARAYYDDTGRCLYCDLREAEVAAGERLVWQSEHFTVLQPFAPQVPDETWILPNRHVPAYGDVADEEIPDLAGVLRDTLRALAAQVQPLAFNYVIQTAPVGEAHLKYYRWHVQIIPRLTTAAGFELGSGISISTALPKETARLLRACLCQTAG